MLLEAAMIALGAAVGVGGFLWHERAYWKGLYEIEAETSEQAIRLLHDIFADLDKECFDPNPRAGQTYKEAFKAAFRTDTNVISFRGKP